MNTSDTCDATLAARLESERAKGLFDVKLLLQNRDEASFGETCSELGMVFEAIDNAKTSDVDFGSLKWKD